MQKHKGAVAFEKMWQPLNVEKADSLRQDRVIQPETVCFLFFAHNNQRFLFSSVFKLRKGAFPAFRSVSFDGDCLCSERSPSIRFLRKRLPDPGREIA